VGTSSASASCAAGVEYRGRFYIAWSDELPVARGELLGRAVYPPCNDGGGCNTEDPGTNRRPTQAWAMRGVDPKKVIIARMEGRRELAVYGRLNADAKDYFRFTGGAWHIRDRVLGNR
jgi:Family of unknown function (DUF6281)